MKFRSWKTVDGLIGEERNDCSRTNWDVFARPKDNIDKTAEKTSIETILKAKKISISMYFKLLFMVKKMAPD